MANTSATGGYLSPATVSPPLEDDALDQLLQRLVRGITGLPAGMVRPRWQPTPPKQPEPSVDWCAIGVTSTQPDAGAYIEHDGTGDGQDRMQRHEDIELACTFYGPSGRAYAALLRDGLSIPQNTAPLRAQGMGFVECSAARSVPELVNQQWIKRYDLVVRLRRQVRRTYPVLNLLSADPQLISD